MSKVYRYMSRATGSDAVARSFDRVSRVPLSCLAAALKLINGGTRAAIDEKALEARIQQLRPYRPSGPPPLALADEDASLGLSIIVPVFNVEAYLANCIDSILNQKTSLTYELIVIDDGSTDGSAAILERYASRPEVTVVRVTNGGVAFARNEGIRRAKGKYLMFVDADDYLPPDCVETLLALAIRDDVDVVQGSYWTVDVGNTVRGMQVFDEFVASRADASVAELSGYPWGKVIRRDLFRNVRFPEGMAYEDSIVAMILLPLANGYISVKQPVYYYRENPRGLTAGLTKNEKTLDAYWVVSRLLSDRRSLGLPPDSHILRQVKAQFGALLYRRLANFDDDVKKAVFYLGCLQIEALRKECNGGRPGDRGDALDYAFRTRNYALWKLLCFFEL
ncbi:glycosyltransferase family 2 protein [Caballeronia ptereochthonis]|uniref:Glycosyltransferase, group 2 family protein n=1 Tax=Caballeronia ptereochthonis TaxID=1777144 RepID=A0A158B1G0_9BURK|nr:glycosyltransferase [Caballeronia ptereochthonis]SAK63894.1 glycosyltransferase, group 2 family protein [Caballeronia ptereochthonis]